MDKVIVERPRRGSVGWARKGRDRPLTDEDGTPLRARAPRSDRKVKTKELNENLAPLFRYLDRQVNRPWNKVWSEISARLRPTSTVQEHVRDHVRQYVAIKTSVRDGVVMVQPHYGRETPLKGSWHRLYVDPRTGILRRNPHYASWSRAARRRAADAKKARAARMQVVDATTQLHKLKDGTWWEVTLGPAPGEKKRPLDERWGWDSAAVSRPDIDAQDVVLRAGLTDMRRAELYGMHGVMAVEKRQLSARDVKKRGLK